MRAPRHWNLSPAMALAVALLFLSMWVGMRVSVAESVRVIADVAVGTALVLLLAQGLRGPRIEYASLHRLLRPWLVVLLVAGLLSSALNPWPVGRPSSGLADYSLALPMCPSHSAESSTCCVLP
jgi:hypothetical protein